MGLHMLDAPVSGGPTGAASRKLAIWVGGDEKVFNQYKALLDAIGDRAAYIGPIGSATVAKLVHNMSGYAIVCALAETFTLGVKAGIDPLTLWQAVRQGAVGRRFTFDALIDQFLPGEYDPPAFALKLAHKDVALANALGRELGMPMRICNLTLAEMTEALARGWGGRDSRVVMLLQQERAGVEIAVERERLREALAPAVRKTS
jgi:3-hydroxyisobutyrate dehydrogenase